MYSCDCIITYIKLQLGPVFNLVSFSTTQFDTPFTVCCFVSVFYFGEHYLHSAHVIVCSCKANVVFIFLLYCGFSFHGGFGEEASNLYQESNLCLPVLRGNYNTLVIYLCNKYCVLI